MDCGLNLNMEKVFLVECQNFPLSTLVALVENLDDLTSTKILTLEIISGGGQTFPFQIRLIELFVIYYFN